MLQLQTKAVDICRISKLLVKYNVKASITDSVITLDGDVSDELLTKLCDSVDINAVQNFISEVVEEPEKIETQQASPVLSNHLPKYDLIYPTVKRGQVYWCDLGIPYGSEMGFMRPVIIVQNDSVNSSSPTTIAIPCTTTYRNHISTHYHCTFSSQNMVDFDSARVDTRKTNICAESIRCVNKTCLRKYIGTLTPEFMKIVQEKLDIALDLSREVKTIVKQEKVYIDRPVPQKVIANPETSKEHKDVNMVQVQLLSFVDINELFKISQSRSADEVKAQKILELFGFDFKKNGVQHLLKAILVSPKDAYFNLETLSENVSRKESTDKEEIKRLIIARVKENFGFKKAPTIDFIRLVNNFLVKQEADHEETDI